MAFSLGLVRQRSMKSQMMSATSKILGAAPQSIVTG
jgi:hypothetical protein